MSDSEFSDLFAAGTAPDRDPDFALRVAVDISRARLRKRLLALALRATVVMMIAVAIFVASSLIQSVLAQLLDGSSEFMGVPVPVVVGAVVAALALRAGRYLLPTVLSAPPP